MNESVLLLGRRAGRSVAGRRDGRCCGGWKRLQLVDAASEVRQKSLADSHVQSGGCGQISRHFGGAVGESGPEFVLRRVGRRTAAAQSKCLTFSQLVQVADSQFQNVGFLQFGQIFAFRRQSRRHQLLQLVQTPVDPGTTFAFQHRLHNLLD